MMWLTPWRPWLLTVNGLAIMGLFYLLYCCRCRLELRLFGAIFAVAGLSLFLFAFWEVYAIADMAAWAHVNGKATHCGASGLSASKFQRGELAYEYVVGGKQYLGHEDSWQSSRMRYGWDKDLHRIYPSYGWNEEVVVYYNPSQPAQAVLRPGLSYATAFVLRTSLLGVLGGMILLVASTQLRQTPGPASRIDRTANAVARRLGVTYSFDAWTTRVAFIVLAMWGFFVITRIQPIQQGEMKEVRVDAIPVTADQFCYRGLDLLREHDPKRAFNNFTRGLRLDPNHAAVYYDRGHACVQMGQMAQALDDWRKAIQLDWRMAFHVYYAHRRLASDDVALDESITRVALDHLSDLDRVSGYAVGAMADAGEFYTASLILSSHLTDEDFLRMAGNEEPVVRAMALICLARRDIMRHETTIRSFYNDPTEVMYVPVGCGVTSISLGTLARNIIEDRDTLQYWDPEKTRRLWQREQSK